MARTKGSNAEQTKARIMHTALELFSQRTFAGTSLRDISDQLGMTKSAFYYHFESKDALLRAIIAPLAEQLDDIATETIKGRAELAADDMAGSDALRVQTLRRLVQVQIDSLPLRRLLMSDPSVIAPLRDHPRTFGLDEQFERAFAGSSDETVLMRHRCALGAIGGGLMFAAKAQLRAQPDLQPQQLTSLLTPHFEVLLNAALAVLGITVPARESRGS
jgi:AcrR family transcriptional regulator